MKREAVLSRRQILARVASGGAALGLAGCDRLSNATRERGLFSTPRKTLRARVQRALLAPRDALAPEYGLADHFAGLQAQWLGRPGRSRLRSRRATNISSIGSSTSAASSTSRCSCRSPNSDNCRRARRSPATIASKAGAASANGKARRSGRSSTAAGLKPQRATSPFIAPTRWSRRSTEPGNITRRSISSTRSIRRRSSPMK